MNFKPEPLNELEAWRIRSSRIQRWPRQCWYFEFDNPTEEEWDDLNILPRVRYLAAKKENNKLYGYMMCENATHADRAMILLPARAQLTPAYDSQISLFIKTFESTMNFKEYGIRPHRGGKRPKPVSVGVCTPTSSENSEPSGD